MMDVGETFTHPFITKKKKCHIRAFVDDMTVFRWWKSSKQYWQYDVIETDYLSNLMEK